ncbi:unnamed protein product [Symbiodinium sp. CCMP2456]|nr:unnamed protein product [Symbiodinium sp. CCMP2456]
MGGPCHGWRARVCSDLPLLWKIRPCHPAAREVHSLLGVGAHGNESEQLDGRGEPHVWGVIGSQLLCQARELLQRRKPPAPRRKPRVNSPKRKRKPRTSLPPEPPTPKAKGKAKAEAKAEAKAALDTGASAAESVEAKPETTPMKENELEDSLAFMEEGEEEFPDICFEEEGDEEEMLLDDELLDLESEEDLDLEDDEEEEDSDQDDVGEAAT